MYFCDVHPGMVGVIEVVEDDVAIASAGEVEAQAQQELTEQMSAALPVFSETQANAQSEAVDGVVEVITGSGNTGRVTINQFSNPYVVIQAGESVSWVNPSDGIEPHFVNSSPYDAAALPEFVPIMQENAPPILSIGPGFLGTTADGSVINAGDSFNSTFILPGQSFTLTFSEPGVYAYTCHIHPNMNGVVVVEPAA
jgi:plastocyanin